MAFHIQDAKPNSPTPLPSMPTSCKLPIEILGLLRDTLREEKMSNTAATLCRANKQFYTIFIPAVRYERLKVTQRNASQIFEGISGMPSPSTYIFEGADGRRFYLDVEDMSEDSFNAGDENDENEEDDSIENEEEEDEEDEEDEGDEEDEEEEEEDQEEEEAEGEDDDEGEDENTEREDEAESGKDEKHDISEPGKNSDQAIPNEHKVTSAHEPIVPLSTSSHVRKLALLERCRYLHLADLAALRRLIEARDAAGGLPFMTNVSHLSLGARLVYCIGMAVDQHLYSLIKRLGSILDPRHLCVTYSIGSQREFMSRRFEQNVQHDDDEDFMEWMESGDDIWPNQLVRGITSLIHFLNRFWNLKSVTCHNFSVQELPRTDAKVHRIFYARHPQSFEIYAFTGKPSESRPLRIQAAFQWTLLTKTRYELIGVGTHLCESGYEWESTALYKLEKSVQARDPEFEVVGGDIEFRSQLRAARCVCCGRH